MSRAARLANQAWPPAALLVVVLAAWQLAVSREWVSSVILPLPTDVASAFVELVVGPMLWENVWATTFEAVVGFSIGAGAGVALAVVAGLSPLMRRMLTPYAISLQVTPLIAIAPLLIAWLGFGYTSKIAIAALICFFPVFVNTLTGVLSIGADEREMFRSLGATRNQTFRRLMLPHALPLTFAGLKTAMTLALIGAVVGEFVSAQTGLGLLVKRFSYQLAVPDAFAVVLVLTLLGLTLYALMSALERAVVFWSHDELLTARTRRRSARARRRGDERLGDDRVDHAVPMSHAGAGPTGPLR